MNYRENKDIINQIVLWKMNRRPQVAEELIDAIHKLEVINTPMEAVENELTVQVVVGLLASKGMQQK